MRTRGAHEGDPLIMRAEEAGAARRQRGAIAAAVLASAAVGVLLGAHLPRRDDLLQKPPPKGLGPVQAGTRSLSPLAHPPATPAPPPPTTLDAWEIIKDKKFVDLTHAFDPSIPSWPGFPAEKVQPLYSYDSTGGGELGTGFQADMFCHVGQWGTHADPPSHFAPGKRTLDQISPEEMVLPLVVIDVSAQAAAHPDYTIRMVDVQAWEGEHGVVPERAFVVMRTDWSKRWPDSAAMANKDSDGVPHYPGWSMEVLSYLFEVRKVTATGHETTDTDPGVAVFAGDVTLETYVAGTDHYQIELLANVDKVPPHGALAIVSFPKPKDGSGFPARVIAILP